MFTSTSTAASWTATSTGRRMRRPDRRRCSTGTATRPTSASRRSSPTCGPEPSPLRRRHRARACWRCSATRSRPTTSRPPAPSSPTARPAGTCIEHGVEPPRVQLLRLAARQPRGDGARHLRQHPAAQPPGAGRRGRRHDAPADRRAAVDLRRRRCATSEAGTPLVVLAGKEYGSGSSRDWAAKGTLLLGVRAVIAECYERIHRSNLVGMGVLPLQFLPRRTPASRSGSPAASASPSAARGELAPRQRVTVEAVADDGTTHELRGAGAHRRAGRARLPAPRRHPADGAAADDDRRAVGRRRAASGLDPMARRAVGRVVVRSGPHRGVAGLSGRRFGLRLTAARGGPDRCSRR